MNRDAFIKAVSGKGYRGMNDQEFKERVVVALEEIAESLKSLAVEHGHKETENAKEDSE